MKGEIFLFLRTEIIYLLTLSGFTGYMTFPGDCIGGGHAYLDLQEVIIALSGSFDVVIHNGQEEKVYTLNRSYFGLYVPRMTWRHLENFSTNALGFIACDDLYKEDGYIRDFEHYKQKVFK
jgi:hypothetical protein